jgi:hypothetical protein
VYLHVRHVIRPLWISTADPEWGKNLKNLVFKSSQSALEYIEKFYTKPKTLKSSHIFFGRIDSIEHSDDGHTLYVTEIIVSRGWMFKKNVRQIVFGMLDPSIEYIIEESDLILWEAHNIETKIPIGFVIKKLSLEWDVESQQFLPFEHPQEPKSQDMKAVNLDALIKLGQQMADADIDNKFGKILLDSEFLEDKSTVYIIFSHNGRKVVGWDNDRSQWILDTSEIATYGFAPSSPKKFKETVFNASDVINRQRKRSLTSYLLFGVPKGYKKQLVVDTSAGSVTFWFSSKDWNDIVIGEPWQRTVVGEQELPDGQKTKTEFTLTINWNGTRSPRAILEEGQDYGKVSVWYEDPVNKETSIEVFSGILREITGYHWDAKKDE